MIRHLRTALLALAATLVLLPGLAFAQGGNIAGTVRDPQGGVLPGVTVEVTSPNLIEKVRSTVTDGNGRYQITSLPVGIYKVSFKLEKFGTVEKSNVELSSEFTATVNGEMKLGTQTEVLTVVGSTMSVDVQNARQRQVFSGEELRDLPVTRNLNSLVQLVPGISVSNAGGLFSTNSVPTICSGGQADGGGGPGSFTFNTSGSLSGCSPITQAFNAHSSMNDGSSLNQGRMQVDGLGIQSFGGGGRSSYIADIGNAQEVTFTLSGSLGESETGGTTINIVPRTGGNRYTGNYFTAFSNGHFFGKNNETRPSTFTNRLDREYDVNGSFGGPIVRDRLWFYAAARRQERDGLLLQAYRNANEGVFGANYRRTDQRVMQDDLYQNASLRLTIQASQRDKFNVFWDEQYTCETPCHGTSGSPVSVEAQASLLTYPLHVAQLSWTNTLTNKILLDAGFSHYNAHRDETRNRYEKAYPSLPRVVESGSNVDIIGASALSTVTSGSLNNSINWNIDNVQSRASASYITGDHNVKFGYQGQYLSRVSRPGYNDLRLNYGYSTPASTCSPTAPTLGNVTSATPVWCGLYPDGVTRVYDGLNVNLPLGNPLPANVRPPVPLTVQQFIPAGSDEAAWFAAFYLQDQWTWNRFTLSGALRYDHAYSHFGKTCVGPDLYLPTSYCLNDPANGDDGAGVNYQDITPRIGASWDVFGNGKTAIKFSVGKYLDGVQAGGIYTASNPASGGRTINSYQRAWRDLDGDRVVDCDLTVPSTVPPAGQSLPTNGECGPEVLTFGQTIAGARRFGRSPDALDDAGLAIGLNTIYCGQNERSMSQLIRNYCDNYFNAGGDTLLNGWNKRRYEWQYSAGVQHELLPRLSAEVTYNRRNIGNQTVTDTLQSGCDLYSTDVGGTVNSQQCMDDLLRFQSTFYDFYSVTAPKDPRLPGGGGYVVRGVATRKQTLDANGAVTYVTPSSAGVQAVTLAADGANVDYWSGVDTNFVLRAKYGIRVTGGTSTGRRVQNTCAVMVDDPPTGQVLNEGRERGCDRTWPFQTNMRGTASYTVPWIDVLVSSTFSYRPGVTISSNYRVGLADLVYEPGTVRLNTNQFNNTTGYITQNLLSNDTYGEGIRIVDLRLAKNIRFKGKRINVGADLFNMFNSDAATAYCADFPSPSQQVEGCGSAAAGTLRPYNAVTNTTTPRYARFQVQFDF